MSWLKAEILINGPKGQAFATVELDPDGKLHPALAEQALAAAVNHYNEMPMPKEFSVVNEHAKIS